MAATKIEEVNPLLIEGFDETKIIEDEGYDKDWQMIISARQNGKFLQAELSGIENKRINPNEEETPCGIILIGNIRGYIPIKELGLQREKLDEARALTGLKIAFKVLAYTEDKKLNSRFFVASRKQAKEEMAKITLKRIKVGSEIIAIVRGFDRTGVKAEIGGIDVVIPITEIRHGWIDDITEEVKVGQHLKVKVTELDVANGTVNVSAKALLKNEWDNVSEKFKKGSEYVGTVSGVRDYGVFINLADGVDSLAPHLKFQNLRKSDKVLVRILNIDSKEKKINVKIVRVI